MHIMIKGSLAALGALALAQAASGPALGQPEERLDGRKLTATLTGAAEVPAADPNGAGLFEARINPGQERICYTLSAGNIDEATAAHIHSGAAGVNGPPIVDLAKPEGDDDDVQECHDIDRSLAMELIQNPQNYYVNVHTGEYPNGAIRGQLSK